MKKEYDYTIVLNKIFTTLVIIAILIATNTIIQLVKLSNSKNTTSSSEIKEQEQLQNNYDVSSFTTLSLNGVLNLFDKKGTNVLYLGRSTCSACVSFLPTLKEAQQEYKYTTNYLDITTVNTASDEYKKFMEKLTKEITENINGTEKTGKISEFYGYTPMVIIIKDGKAVDASVGAYNITNFKKFLNKNGIK